jgi:hypothetical protein
MVVPVASIIPSDIPSSDRVSLFRKVDDKDTVATQDAS